MGLIQKHKILDAGFHPVLIRDSWQVSKLNYEDKYHINNLKCLLSHELSDRAISLLSGYAVLISSQERDPMNFDFTFFRLNSSYNIPKRTPYAIIMKEGTELFCVESPHNHKHAIKEYPLDQNQIESIQNLVKLEFQ